jgi:hypothetical protein
MRLAACAEGEPTSDHLQGPVIKHSVSTDSGSSGRLGSRALPGALRPKGANLDLRTHTDGTTQRNRFMITLRFALLDPR